MNPACSSVFSLSKTPLQRRKSTPFASPYSQLPESRPLKHPLNEAYGDLDVVLRSYIALNKDTVNNYLPHPIWHPPALMLRSPYCLAVPMELAGKPKRHFQRALSWVSFFYDGIGSLSCAEHLLLRRALIKH